MKNTFARGLSDGGHSVGSTKQFPVGNGIRNGEWHTAELQWKFTGPRKTVSFLRLLLRNFEKIN